MTPQTNTTTLNPDARIDQVLQALRTTEPPAGMEERIAQRLAARMQHTDARTRTLISRTSTRTPERTTAPFFAVILNAVKGPRLLPTQAELYATAATALALAASLTFVHFRIQNNAAIAFHRESSSATTTQAAQGFSLGSHKIHQEAGASTPALSQAAHLQAPHAFVLVSHDTEKRAGVPIPASTPDPDAIALAETLAPTLAAPPQPLTPQEQLIASAARPGQPIQLAELDTARQPFLHAEARARTDAAIARYVHSLLAPFAVADRLQPTTFSQPQETPTPPPAPQSTDSSSR